MPEQLGKRSFLLPKYAVYNLHIFNQESNPRPLGIVYTKQHSICSSEADRLKRLGRHVGAGRPSAEAAGSGAEVFHPGPGHLLRQLTNTTGGTCYRRHLIILCNPLPNKILMGKSVCRKCILFFNMVFFK